MPDNEWIDRERARFETGHYKRPGWIDEGAALPSFHVAVGDPRALHFAHVSREDSSLIAYTESEEKGRADKKRQIKPGRYLEKFFSDRLTKPQIAAWAARYRATVTARIVAEDAQPNARDEGDGEENRDQTATVR